jgi:hypothetical protein
MKPKTATKLGRAPAPPPFLARYPWKTKWCTECGRPRRHSFVGIDIDEDGRCVATVVCDKCGEPYDYQRVPEEGEVWQLDADRTFLHLTLRWGRPADRVIPWSAVQTILLRGEIDRTELHVIFRNGASEKFALSNRYAEISEEVYEADFRGHRNVEVDLGLDDKAALRRAVDQIVEAVWGLKPAGEAAP